MIVQFSTSERFVKDPIKSPFESDTDYWFDDVQFVSFRPGIFKFSGVTSYDGHVGYDPGIDFSQFSVVPEQTFYELNIEEILKIRVDGVCVWEYE